MKISEIASFGYVIYYKNGTIQQLSGNLTPLKYGEAMANPAAYASLHTEGFQALHPASREVGFVNHLDVVAAARFMLTTKGTGIFKHTGICGAAYGFASEATEYAQASRVDDVARFGGIVGTPRVTRESAEEIVGRAGQKKQDAIVALTYEPGALEILLRAKNQPLIYIVDDPSFDIIPIDVQQGIDGLILQERIPPLQPKDLTAYVSGKQPISERVLQDVTFGFKAIDTRYSNAVGFVLPGEDSPGTIVIGIAGGPSDRVTAAYHAMEKTVWYCLTQYLSVPRDQMTLAEYHPTLYMVSDGFFPDTAALEVTTPTEVDQIKNRLAHYPYNLQREALARNKKITTQLEDEQWSLTDKLKHIAERLTVHVPLVLNPGGSKKDEAVIQYARDHNMTMLITERDGKHLRCFKHGPQSAYKVQ